MYEHVSRNELIDALIYIRALYRQIKPRNERELLAHERREAAIKDLLSNVPRTSEHPTLNTLLEIADVFALTLDGTHRLFGYDLDRLREYDLVLNGGRTHIEGRHERGSPREIHRSLRVGCSGHGKCDDRRQQRV